MTLPQPGQSEKQRSRTDKDKRQGLGFPNLVWGQAIQSHLILEVPRVAVVVCVHQPPGEGFGAFHGGQAGLCEVAVADNHRIVLKLQARHAWDHVMMSVERVSLNQTPGLSRDIIHQQHGGKD